MTSKELREKRGPLAEKIKEMAETVNTENRDFTAEEQENWDKVNQDYNDLSRQIGLSERAEEVKSDQDLVINENAIANRSSDGSKTTEPHGGDDMPESECRALSLQAWARVQCKLDLTERHVEACKRAGVNPKSKDFEVQLRTDYGNLRREIRAQSVGTDSAGGFAVPTGFVNSLERALLQFGGVRQVADVIRTATGNDLPWPTVDDASNAGALLAENASVTEQDVTFGATTFNAYKYTSKLVKVSTELMTDSAFNMEQVLGSLLGERLGRIQNTHFTTGTGSSQPNGIVTASTAGKTTASATAFTALEVIDLIHSVDPAYRTASGFMMNDLITSALRQLVDSNGQLMWQTGMVGGAPDTIYGHPVTVNQDMDGTIGTASKIMLFGDFSRYKIRDVAGLRIRRLDERYADNDQVAFVAFSRHDGDLLNAGTNPVKHMITA